MDSLTIDELRAVAKTAWTLLDDKKELDNYVLTMRCVFETAVAIGDANNNNDYLQFARATAYNIAASVWPGWEDAHDGISSAHLQLGESLCRFHIERGIALKAPPERRAGGYWLLGAHLLAQGRYEDARAAFQTSIDLNKQMDAADAALMAQGWILVTETLAGTDRSAELTVLSNELAQMGDDGKFYASQYEPAMERLQAG